MTAFHDIYATLKAGYLFPESYCLRIERMLSVVLGLLRLSLKVLYNRIVLFVNCIDFSNYNYACCITWVCRSRIRGRAC
jgi:hypothetical protein